MKQNRATTHGTARKNGIATRSATRKRWTRRVIAVGFLGWLCAAPTPGDIGGCGQPAVPLDPARFAQERQELDCERCTECNVRTYRCNEACTTAPPSSDIFPAGCAPLIHDGFVCLRALEHASCEDYQDYLSDTAPTAPTECDFCSTEAEP